MLSSSSAFAGLAAEASMKQPSGWERQIFCGFRPEGLFAFAGLIGVVRKRGRRCGE